MRRTFRSLSVSTSLQEISRQFVTLSLGTAILFIVVGLFIMSLGSFLPSSFTLRNAALNFPSQTIYQVIANEVPVLRQDVQASNDQKGLLASAISILSSINPKDPRSFLGRELPMFKMFDGRLLVAGEGVDYTSLPLESSPPLEVLLSETEAVDAPVATEETSKEQEKPVLSTNGRKVVFIYHTHNRESFFPQLPNIKDTSNEDLAVHPTTNITLVGKHFGKALSNRGIGNEVSNIDYALDPVVQDNFWKSYAVSMKTVQEALSTNKDYQYVFDFHRDSQRRKLTTVDINGTDYARIMFVIGEGHKNWEQNEALARALDTKLNELYPGLSRGIMLKTKKDGDGVYNQHVSPNALTVEIGGVDNSLEETYRTASALADAVAAIYWDAEKVDSPGQQPATPQ